MKKEMTADFLVEDVKVLEQYMNRMDVLDKVKKLLLLPELDMATTQQVADFYEVPLETIRSLVNRYKSEIEPDGMVKMTGKEFKYAGTPKNLFPRRAILRVGMLLRDSEVAKEVRTQLLNIEEKAKAEVKIAEITEKDALLLAVIGYV